MIDFDSMVNKILEEYVNDIKGMELKFNFVTRTIEKESINKYISIRQKKITEEHIPVKFFEIYDRVKNIKKEFVIGPVKMLFSNSMLKFRKELLNTKSLEGVITIKMNFFLNSQIPLALLLFNKDSNKTWFTSVSNVDELKKLLFHREDYDRNIYYSNNVSVENLMPELYSNKISKINKELDKLSTKRLCEIADLFMGKYVNKRHFDIKGIPYITPRCLQKGKILKFNKFVSDDYAERCSKQLLQVGDILLTKNFGQYKLVKVNIGDLPAIASDGLIIIRAFDVPENYLYKYFTSYLGNKILKNQLQSIEVGSTIKTITLKALKEIKIPMYNLDTMINISDIENSDIYEMTQVASEIRKESTCKTEYDIEKNVYKSFIKSGWRKEDIIFDNHKDFIELSNKMKIYPDMIIMEKNDILAIVEVKNLRSHISLNWVKKIRKLLKSKQIRYFILTTGEYFEIYICGTNKVFKKFGAPTKRELLGLIESGVSQYGRKA